MRRYILAGAISAAVLAAAVAGVDFSASESMPDPEYRARSVARALVSQGHDPAEIPALVRQRIGIPTHKSKAALREAASKIGRHPESRFTEHVGVISRNRSATIAAEAIAWAICSPFANCTRDESLADCRARGDQTFIEFLTPCLERERTSLGEPFCLRSDGRDVARGARLRMTPEQWRRLVQARGDLPAQVLSDTTVIRGADDAAYMAEWARLGVERCAPESP